MKALPSRIRPRLACTIAVLTVMAGVLVVLLDYALLRRSLASPSGEVVRIVRESSSGRGNRDFAIRDLERAVVHHALHEMLLQSLVAVALVGLASVGVAWVAAGRVVRPVGHIAETARRISHSNLHERIALAGPPDELTSLGETIDELLERLEAAFSAQVLFAANASHELRTPLAIARTAVDVTLADDEAGTDELRLALGRVRDALARSDRLLSGLLALARGQASELDSRQAVALDGLAEDVCSRLQETAHAARVSVVCHVEPAVVIGDPVLLSRALQNLIENAIRYNRTGGLVSVEVGRSLGEVRAVVANTGETIDEPTDLAELLQPFRKAGRPRTGAGTGLGLSIVASVAAAHGGRINLDRRAGGGLVVTLALPAGGRTQKLGDQS